MEWTIQNLFLIINMLIACMFIYLFIKRPHKVSQFKRKRKTKRVTVGKRLKKYFDIIGVKPGSSKTAILVAYRKKIKQCHPDKVARKSKAIRQRAKEQTILLHKAKAKLIKEGGKAA